jgi:hypothetical protein
VIVDKDKRFIFVHNPRTGGTSIRSVLRQYQDDEMYNDLGARLENTNFKDVVYSHTDHASIDIFPIDVIENYKYIFTCVRNPFARTYSYYCRIRQGIEKIRSAYPDEEPEPSSEEFIKLKPPASWAQFIEAMWKSYDNENSINRFSALCTYPYDFWTSGVDEAWRLEDLAHPEQWNALMHKCGIKDPPARPHENRSYRESLFEYRKMYTDDQRLKIEKIFEPEIEKYGYEF